MKVSNKPKTSILLTLIKYIFLLLICVITFYPVIYAVFGSFKSNLEVTLGGTLWPREWLPANYLEAWSQFDFLRYSLNSIFLSAFTTLFSLIVSSMAGYCISRKQFPGRKLLERIILATMFISIGTVTLRPIFLMMVRIGLHRSLMPVALIITSAGMGQYIF